MRQVIKHDLSPTRGRRTPTECEDFFINARRRQVLDTTLASRCPVSAPPTSYDQIPYPCNAYAQTHPDHLAVLARLHGLTPAPPERCRVLEIGCGDGGNLLPLGYALPNSRFLGIDLATTSIESGQKHAREFGLANVELRALDLTALRKEDIGEWDYIIAHGVFSWVPEPVRAALLRLCREVLAPQGIAFISYNAYPGCHVRHMVREMLLYHTENAPEPQVKIAQGRALMQFLAQGHGSDDDYGQMLKGEAERVLTFDSNHFYHDDLAELNQPFYLHQFADVAAAHGLQYLGDADYSSMHDTRYPKAVREVLAGLGDDPVRKEQYLDFLKCRRFRQTLLCHQEAPLLREVPAEILREFFYSSSARPVAADAALLDSSTVHFQGEAGLKLNTSHPAAKVALAYLGLHWPGYVAYADLEAATAAALGSPLEPGLLETLLREFLHLGTAEAHFRQAPFTLTPGERPQTSAWARYQAKFGGGITTLRHHTVQIRDDFGLWLLTQLDGTRSADEIAVAMAGTVQPAPGQTLDLEKEIRDARQVVAEALETLCGLGVMEGVL